MNRERSWYLLSYTGLAVLCTLVYANSFGNEFVAGDIQFIVENPTLAGWSALESAFAQDYWFVGEKQVGASYYRPLVVLLNALDHALYGLDPRGFHVTNTLLHILATWLVYRLGELLLERRGTALLASALFAVHPIQVPAVSYISARTSVLATVFYLATVLLALRLKQSKTDAGAPWRKQTLIVAAFACALLAKESAVTLPAILALLFWYPERPPLRTLARRYGPLFVSLGVVLIVYLALRQGVMGGVLSSKRDLWTLVGFFPALLTIAKTYIFYLQKLLLPVGLSYLPPFIPAIDASDAAGLVSLLWLVLIAIGTVRLPRSWHREKLGICWLALTLLPVSGIVPLGHFVKGNYAYLPSVGFCMVIALVVMRGYDLIHARRGPLLAMVSLGGLIAVVGSSFAVLTWNANEEWKTPASLHRRVLALEGEIPAALFDHPVMARSANRFALVHFNVAQKFAREKRCPDALPHYARAIQLTRQKHQKLETQYLRARCLFRVGAYDKAYSLYLDLVSEMKKEALPPLRVAWILMQRGEPTKAQPYWVLACKRGAEAACAELKRLPQEPHRPR